MFCFYGQETCRILAPQPGIEPTPSALESKFSTTGQAEKSSYFTYILMKEADHKGKSTWAHESHNVTVPLQLKKISFIFDILSSSVRLHL